MNFPNELKYTNDHEWVRLEGDVAYVGITDFAQSELGEIVFVDVNVDETFDKNEVFGSIEAVKTVADLLMPIAGEVFECNEELEDAPELVNSDPYGKGWLVKIRVSDASQMGELMDADAYKTLIGQ